MGELFFVIGDGYSKFVVWILVLSLALGLWGRWGI